MDTVLSSFAISVAANVVSSLFARNDTEKDIRAAFQEAVERWSPNEDIRRHQEQELRRLIEEFAAAPLADTQSLSAGQREFLSYFEKSLAAHPAAFNYLSAIKGKEYYDVVMSSLNGVHRKLDAIAERLEAAAPQHEELHLEAVAGLNTVISDVVESPVNTLLSGIISVFDDDIFAYTEIADDGNIKVVIDKDSMLEEEDGCCFRPKFHDFDYDWEKERRPGWTELNPDTGLWEMFQESYIAAFQVMEIDFHAGIEALQECIDRRSINDQLSRDEKRQLNVIVQNMRAVQCVIDDHEDIFVHVEGAEFKNLEVRPCRKFRIDGIQFGHFELYYNADSYTEKIAGAVAPIEAKEHLLDVLMINPDYYYKLSGYLGELILSVQEWWRLSSAQE